MTKLKIAIQGITASFHEVAAMKYFGENIQSIECMSFRNLCDVLKNDEADYAIMAIENSIAGSILENYSLLQNYRFNIIGEVYLRIHQCLMALPGTKIEDLKLVESHPIAIRQCAEFLNKIPNALLVDKEDTAAVAKQIAEEKLAGVAAVASRAAAEKFGLEILAENIETNKQNFTRFLILSKQASTSEKNNKTSMSFQLSHHPGSLAKVLNIFHEKNINLTKIQSIPVVGKPYQYAFHIDVIWDDKNNYNEALQAITTFATDILILGEYEKGDFNNLS